MFHFLLIGMSTSRTSSVVALSEMARFTRSADCVSAASFSIPGTSPAVDTVMRRREKSAPASSVRMSSARIRFL